ncbi:hypothetical protein TNCV_3456301 [Trichonephila clavipes]|nr:hypothetical protein TNCV_3456301 [Trichonephila clavipes]
MKRAHSCPHKWSHRCLPDQWRQYLVVTSEEQINGRLAKKESRTPSIPDKKQRPFVLPGQNLNLLEPQVESQMDGPEINVTPMHNTCILLTQVRLPIPHFDGRCHIVRLFAWGARKQKSGRRQLDLHHIPMMDSTPPNVESEWRVETKFREYNSRKERKELTDYSSPLLFCPPFHCRKDRHEKRSTEN